MTERAAGTSRAGALWIIAFGLAGVAWFALELLPPIQGLTDGDNPALRSHSCVGIRAPTCRRGSHSW